MGSRSAPLRNDQHPLGWLQAGLGSRRALARSGEPEDAAGSLLQCMKAMSALLLAACAVLVAPLSVEAARCTIDGTSGNDRLVGTSGPDVICGHGGMDRISGYGGNDILYGGGDRDVINSGGGDDRAFGASGDDQIFAGNGTDILRGGRDGDSLYDGRSDDRLIGGSGRDFVLIHIGGADVARGGQGSDQCLWSGDGEGNDRVLGGPGTDIYRTDDVDVRRSVEVQRHCADVGIPRG
jgi:Ca2+-binding RTX toxin-like protein